MLFALFLLFSEKPSVWERSNEDFSNFIRSFREAIVTEKDEIYVLDVQEQRIYHLDAEGREKNVFSRKGEGPGEMLGAYNIQYHQGLKTLFLYSWGKQEFYAFSLDGEPLPFKIPSKNAPIILGKNQLAYIDGPLSKTEPDQGAVITIEDHLTKNRREIFKNDAKRHQDPARVSNEQGSATTSFAWYATSLLDASPDLRWLVMGSNTSLDFRVYDLKQKKMLGHIQDKQVIRHPLSEEEIAATPTRITLGSKVFRAKDFWHPDYKPPVSKVFFDTQGRVWVALTKPWQAKQIHYRVFTRDGKSVGKFQLPTSEKILHASKTHLWLTRYDEEEDVDYLQKRTYQLSLK